MKHQIQVDTAQLLLMELALSLLLTHLNTAQGNLNNVLLEFEVEDIQSLIEETILLKNKLNPLSL